MKKILEFLQIKKIGFLEVLLALYPIVAGYKYGEVLMGPIWLLLMDLIALKRNRFQQNKKLLAIVFLFIIAHELLVWAMTGFPKTHFNYLFILAFGLISLFIIAPTLKYEQFEGSLYLVGYITCLGIIYHFILLLTGRPITPISLPFLPTPEASSRLFEEHFRPCSFFWEPASFVTYAMIPLFISLTKKNWPLVVFFTFCIFLSTSTNGIILVPIMIAVFLMSGRQKIFGKLLVLVLLIGLVYWLFNSQLFDAGVDKLANTEWNNNARTSNGPRLVSQMPYEHLITGIPTHTVEEYESMGYVMGFSTNSFEVFYLSDFWRVLVSYGIFGLILHLLVYFDFIKKDRSLLPYIVVLLVAQFSQSLAFQATYILQICFILSYIYYRRLNS